jgi:hypothetical protein
MLFASVESENKCVILRFLLKKGHNFGKKVYTFAQNAPHGKKVHFSTNPPPKFSFVRFVLKNISLGKFRPKK